MKFVILLFLISVSFQQLQANQNTKCADLNKPYEGLLIYQPKNNYNQYCVISSHFNYKGNDNTFTSEGVYTVQHQFGGDDACPNLNGNQQGQCHVNSETYLELFFIDNYQAFSYGQIQQDSIMTSTFDSNLYSFAAFISQPDDSQQSSQFNYQLSKAMDKINRLSFDYGKCQDLNGMWLVQQIEKIQYTQDTCLYQGTAFVQTSENKIEINIAYSQGVNSSGDNELCKPKSLNFTGDCTDISRRMQLKFGKYSKLLAYYTDDVILMNGAQQFITLVREYVEVQAIN